MKPRKSVKTSLGGFKKFRRFLVDVGAISSHAENLRKQFPRKRGKEQPLKRRKK